MYKPKAKQYESRVFDISTLRGLTDAERYQDKLYGLYDSVRLVSLGLTRVQVVGESKSPVISSNDSVGGGK